MHVLLHNTSFPPMVRSAARLYGDLAKDLSNRGYKVSVVTEFPRRRLSGSESSIENESGNYSGLDGIKIIRVKGVPFPEDNLFVRGLNTITLPIFFFLGTLRVKEPDIIIVYSPPLFIGFSSIFYSMFLNLPVVLNVQDIYPQTLINLGIIKNNILIKYYKKIEKFIYGKVDRIVVHSKGNKKYLISNKLVNQNKIDVVHNWVNDFSNSQNNSDLVDMLNLNKEFLITYAGAMGYAQDLLPILYAAKELKSFHDIRFLLVGEGVLKSKWENIAIKFDLNNVSFFPLLEGSNYRTLIDVSNIGLVPLTEDLSTPVVPGKLLDYMIRGKPVIATINFNSDVKNIIENANCGFVHSTNDINGLVNSILTIYNKPSVRNMMGKNGQQYAQKEFSKEACISEYETIIKDLAGKA